jgi:phenylpyruvate tautomerase PptA (4-oxalocrotonate tautomerase family)
MPHLRFRGVQGQVVAKLSEVLPAPLAKTMSTTEDNFSFEKVNTDFYEAGKPTNSYPFVEVSMFARSHEVQQQAANIITEQIKLASNAEDVIVVFCEYNRSSYFENGKHF